VADLRALKGRRKISMLYVTTPKAAGVDMLSIEGRV
jgi:hypothetical protein